MVDDICYMCYKPVTYDVKRNDTVCTNKKCDIGKNFKKRDYRNKDLDFNIFDVVGQFFFWGGVVALATLGMHTSDDITFVWLLAGLMSTIITTAIMTFASDEIMWHNRSAGWAIRKKFFWWIAIPLRQWH